MKKLSLILLSLIFVMVSCGSDDSEGQNEVTRPQDSEGKVFLEYGKLVDATTNFTQAQLQEALDKYDWEQDYSFYYDNKMVKGRENIAALPLKIQDGRMAFFWNDDGPYQYDYKDITVKGKLLIATHNPDPSSSHFMLTTSYRVIALDLDSKSGRIVMDCVQSKESAIYPCDVRMVWHAVMPE